ncbi:hypothetical protein AS203_09330 [Hoylesella enoeca]|uniref:Uncharacterized protein n=2 Tax=Hoylesella enoeca TaxID=76123 RepID=A0A0S2KMQ8_9BACT|nr:hypothetical protein AS203_09330 [Hoylesella enoeca]
MTTMKTRALLFGIALGAIALSSCSNDDNTKDQKEETQGVRFTITEEGFGADTELTRATPSAQPQIIEAGDCEAEISIERAPAEKLVATRGVTTPVHYTIRAYHNGALRGEMKGTFTPTGFTPDAGYNAYMLLGRNHTYDFVCFNDKVTPNGNNLDVTLANAKDARIGHQQIALTTVDQTINLSSKHVGCRIQTMIRCKKHLPATTATFASRGATVPQTVSYNPATDTYTPTATTTIPTTANNSPASTETIYSSSVYGEAYNYSSICPDYHYVLPTTDAKNLQLNFTGGTIFWNPLNFSISGLSTTSKPLIANGSYTINIKMKPQFTYLMSNGDIGTFRETTFGGGSKTPIAVVLNRGTHMAIALNNTVYTPSWSTSSYHWLQTNTHSVANLTDALTSQATSGIEETWNPAYTHSNVTGNKVKALNPDFPPFNGAANYNPGTAYTGLTPLQWYLPSFSDWKWIYPLGFGDTPGGYDNHYWYGNLVNEAFTQVGGVKITNRSYWSSTEEGIPGDYSGVGTATLEQSYFALYSGRKYHHYPIRPFVKY